LKVLLLLLLAGEEGCISVHQLCELHEEAFAVGVIFLFFFFTAVQALHKS
jgi:hypothetical protein